MNPIANQNLTMDSATFASHVSSASLLVLVLVLIIAVYGEVKENRIPNWLTLVGTAAGLFIGYLSGNEVFWSHLGGLVIGFGFLFIFYLFGGIGGGDVKLMGTVGALMGAELIKPTLFYTTAVGAFLAIMLLVWRKDFWTRVSWGLSRLAFWRRSAGEKPGPGAPITVPYGVAIAAGCLAALFLT